LNSDELEYDKERLGAAAQGFASLSSQDAMKGDEK